MIYRLFRSCRDSCARVPRMSRLDTEKALKNPFIFRVHLCNPRPKDLITAIPGEPIYGHVAELCSGL